MLAFDNENIGSAGRVTQFPNLVGNPRLANPTPALEFDTATFAVPTAYISGKAGRNILRADGTDNWEFSAFKRWPTQERKRPRAAGEFFNLLNHKTFGFPGAQIQTPQFGKGNSRRESGRSIHLGLKLKF